jgi:formate/nitrite transporter FocA (FNT family)
MQLLSRFVLAFGLIMVIAAALLLGKDVIDINQLHAVANANRSTNFPSPLNNVLITFVLAVVGGFLLGLGITLPRRRKV